MGGQVEKKTGEYLSFLEWQSTSFLPDLKVDANAIIFQTIEVQQPDAELQPTVITYINTTMLSPTTPALMTVEITATDFNSTRVVTTVLTPPPQPVVVETTIISTITPNPSRTASKTGSSSPGSTTTTSLTTETVSPSPTVTTTSLTTETVTPSSSSSNVEVTVSISTLLSYITNTTLMTTTTSVFNTTVSTRSIPHYSLPNDSNSSTVEASVSTTSSSSTSSPTPSSAEAPTTATATPQTCDPGPLYIGTSNCVVINSCNATLDTEANRCLHMCASWAGVCKNIDGLEEAQKFCCTSSGCGCAAL